MTSRLRLLTSLCLACILGCCGSSPTTVEVAKAPASLTPEEPATDATSQDQTPSNQASNGTETDAMPADPEWERITEKVSLDRAMAARLTARFLPDDGSIGVLVEKSEASAWWDVTKKRQGDGEWIVESKELNQDAQYLVSADTEVVVSTAAGEVVATARTDARGMARIPLDLDKLFSPDGWQSELTVKADGEEEVVNIPDATLKEHLPIEALFRQAKTAYREKRYEEAAEWAKKVRLRDAGYQKGQMLFVIATDHHLAGRLDQARRTYLSILLQPDADDALRALTQQRRKVVNRKLEL